MKLEKEDKALRLISIPVAFIITFIPLIVRMKKIILNEESKMFWKNNDHFIDLFSYYKSIWLLAVTLIVLIGIIYNLSILNVKIVNRAGISLIASSYVVLVILSAAFSEHKNVAILGFVDRFEGAFVIISYIVLFWGASFLVKSKFNTKLVLTGLIGSSTIISIIGIMQFFKYDIFKTGLGKILITPDSIKGLENSINYPENTLVLFKNTIYATLYNANSFGSYMVMILPIGITIFLRAENKKVKFLYLLYCTLVFANIIGCGSRGAYAGAVLAVITVSFLSWKIIIKKWKSGLAIICCLLVTFLIMDIKADGILLKRIEATYNGKNFSTTVKKIDKLQNFTVESNNLILSCADTYLRLQLNSNKLLAFDDLGKELELENSDKNYVFLDERYSDYTLTISGTYMKVVKGNSSLYFSMSNGTFNLLDTTGEIAHIKPVDKFGFEGLERFASSRGYIWSRSIPLIKNTIFLGHGPDSFAFYFPQEDYIGKLNYMYDAYIIIDKPHNLYLQSAVNTGVVSMLLLILLFTLCIRGNIKIIIKYNCSYAIFNSWVSLAILGATVAYITSALFTDSVVAVAPVFWILLGLGYGIYGVDKIPKL